MNTTTPTALRNEYLLEIGTEELPASFLATAPAELTEKVSQALSEAGLSFEKIQVDSTPRRLALHIGGLPDEQPRRQNTIKGPPTRVALDPSGQPTQAGLGFARKVGLSPEQFNQLKPETLADGETYLVYQSEHEGRPTPSVLAELLPPLILALSGSHFMHWGHSQIKFSRPIRWLVSLWNDHLLPLKLENIPCGQESHGHRLLANHAVTIPSATTYAQTLAKQGHVLVSMQARREAIWTELQQKAASLGGTVPANEDLLDTVSRLTEKPWVLVGHFAERFLSLPKAVIVTVMAAHQKYFPVLQKNEDLLPVFLAVSNGLPQAEETIRQGNERVLRARLEDASFFFAEDQKTPLASRLETLSGITFQKGLGSLQDKTQRVVRLVESVGQALGLSAADIKAARRAAELCKCDLATGMVRELTELQGVMGQIYAQLNGEADTVANAICEHYLPRFNGDALPIQPISIALSLADKLDTLVAVFSQKNAKLPTGSKDPLGLRRMALGIIQILAGNQLTVNLYALLAKAYANLGSLTSTQQDEATTLGLLEEFLHQRLKIWLLEGSGAHEGSTAYDQVDAVFEADIKPLENLPDLLWRLNWLQRLSQDAAGLAVVYEPANRISKILGANYNPQATQTDLASACLTDEDNALLKAIALVTEATEVYEQSNKQSAPDLQNLSHALLKPELAQAVATYFERVMINDPDPAVKQNRLLLLSLLNRGYLRLAKWSLLAI